MKKNISIFLIVILIMQVLVFIAPTKTYASDTAKETSIGEMMSSAKRFLQTGKDDTINEDNLAKVNKTIYNLFLAVAIVIAVIVGAYLGIKIMVGTIEEKAKIKEMLVPYIVGVVVIFAVFPIWNFVVKFGTDTVGEGKYQAHGTDAQQKNRYVVTTEEMVKIHVLPDENSDCIGSPLRKGTSLDYIDDVVGWYKIKYNIHEGYVSKDVATIREY